MMREMNIVASISVMWAPKKPQNYFSMANLFIAEKRIDYMCLNDGNCKHKKLFNINRNCFETWNWKLLVFI